MNFWALAYQFGWATIGDLKQAVQYGAVSAANYKTITGQDYAAPETT